MDIIKCLRILAGRSAALDRLFVEQIICAANDSSTNIYGVSDVLCSMPGVQDIPRGRQMGALSPVLRAWQEERVSCGQSELKQEHGGCGDAEETLSSDTRAWGRFGFTGQLKLLHRLYLQKDPKLSLIFAVSDLESLLRGFCCWFFSVLFCGGLGVSTVHFHFVLGPTDYVSVLKE